MGTDVRKRTMEGNAKLFTHCQLKEVFIKLKQVSGINRKLKKKNIYPQMTHMDTDGGPQAYGKVKSNICYWQKFNYGWHKLKTMCEVLSQCRMRHNG